MIEFWLFAALLLISACAFLWLPALLFRPTGERGPGHQALEVQAYESRLDEIELERSTGRISESEYADLKSELERNLLLDLAGTESPAQTEADTRPAGRTSKWPLALGLSVIVAAITVGLYYELGSSRILAVMEHQQNLGDRLVQLPPAERARLLERELESVPGNVDINYLLAREYMQLKDYAGARRTYQRLVSLTRGHPGVLAEFAQASFFMDGNQLTEQSRALANRAIAHQPNNSTALGLLGIDAFESQRYREAIGYWQRIIDTNPDAPEIESLRIGIARAQAMAGDKPELAPAAAGPELLVSVSLAEELQQRVSPDQTLFVFARAVQGPPMPLAAVRLQAKDLPLEVVLNDAMAMSPMAKLSSVEQVNLVARISQSGTPQGQPGDLEGIFGPINVDSAQSKIKLVIDKVVE